MDNITNDIDKMLDRIAREWEPIFKQIKDYYCIENIKTKKNKQNIMKNIHYEVRIEGNRAIITKTIGDDITRYSTLELSPDEIEMWDNMTSDDIEYHLRTNDDYFKIN